MTATMTARTRPAAPFRSCDLSFPKKRSRLALLFADGMDTTGGRTVNLDDSPAQPVAQVGGDTFVALDVETANADRASI